ncbi:CRISPR-associated protein Cas4 [Nocardia sp. NPDC051990]|uniref:CRISPR-associated protein Cas4 n=1 Tax=Nocardia sp. NPDC051990 TaxID=3155285 RepID=UPI003426676C
MSGPLGVDDRWNVPISAIEHYVYCPRQAVLIWQEAYFESNLDTIRGDLAHAAVDRGGTLTGRAGTKIWRSLPVYNHELGIHGICDTVHWTTTGPVPVEHKSGTYRPGGAADLQVAAQVLCLREMFNDEVPYGELFAGKTRRRHQIDVDERLSTAVRAAVAQLREAIALSSLPPAVNDSRCRRCSLRPGCLPEISAHRKIDLFLPRKPGDCGA